MALINDARRFLAQSVAAPRSVGAIWPSSAALAAAMLAPIDFAAAPTIVEFGPGTGPFTAAILAGLAGRGRYLGIELNPAFCQHLAARFPDADVAQGSVADLTQIAASRGIKRIDAVVSGLPWALLPSSLQDQVFDAMGNLLTPEGTFATFTYIQSLPLPGAWALRRALRARFASVKRSPIVWRNVPPALVYWCKGRLLF